MFQLGITESLGDTAFEEGQLAHAEALGDSGTKANDGTFDPSWLPAFKKGVDGLLFVRTF